MTYRQLRAKPTSDSTLPEATLLNEEMAAYIRQSTTKQTLENLESSNLQLTGAQKYAVRQGLDKDKIIIAHEGDGKRGVSGTLRIDQRERLQEIITDIKAGKIKLVWAYSVSRLFRDKYGVQVSTFIEVCAKHGVKVVIESAKVFDFANSFDIMLFQFLANVAARENEDRAKLLHDANNNKAKRGEYNGRPIVPGFIVDRDKKSETFGKFIPYTPHSKVTERLFRRYHELSGQFNVLAREVALMPVVFPCFDTSIDVRDVAKFQYKKVCKLHGVQCDCKLEQCVHIGYHITKLGLFRLLTSVEVAGYWKHDGQLLTDEKGNPKQNHTAIVDLEDWRYAFGRLSFVNLDGTENKHRVNARATWTATTYRGKDREQSLLAGMLTSPLGTVQSNGGKYKILEQREGMPVRSNTFVIDTRKVDAMFLIGLEAWCTQTQNQLTDNLLNELVGIREKNRKALVSVDEQMTRYEQIIANKQAVLDTLGATMDKPTMIQYNQDIINARANLTALQAKKNAATVEETQLTELSDRFRDFVRGGFKADEHARRFIRLACETIELNEYSAHYATLTITWAAPFHQVDVGYIYLADGVHEPWTEADEYDLAMLYPLVDRLAILERFPSRSWASIACRANDLGITRYTRENTSDMKNNRSMSLLDMEAMKKICGDYRGDVLQNTWERDVRDTTVNNDSGSMSAHYSQVVIVRWLFELRAMAA